LVIRPANTDSSEYLKNSENWEKNAFEHGIELISKEPKFYMDMHGVDVEINIEDKSIKKWLQSN
jgi:hypothetical protein